MPVHFIIYSARSEKAKALSFFQSVYRSLVMFSIRTMLTNFKIQHLRMSVRESSYQNRRIRVCQRWLIRNIINNDNSFSPFRENNCPLYLFSLFRFDYRNEQKITAIDNFCREALKNVLYPLQILRFREISHRPVQWPQYISCGSQGKEPFLKSI